MTDPDRPLVTFALFAYNQENYIREAIEGAFSQTYEPLEIILSDDCSSDRTYQIMQEMAAEYDGPHEVRVRQSAVNAGTLKHVLDVVKDSKGGVLVVAAGDDISLPHRTNTLMPHLMSSEALAICSNDLVVDATGAPADLHSDRFELREKWHADKRTMLLGATAAYKRNLLETLPYPDFPILNEDTVFQEVLSINSSESIYLKEALIKRRTHDENVAFKEHRAQTSEELENKAIKNWQVQSVVMIYCVKVAEQLQSEDSTEIRKKYQNDAEYFHYLSRWPNLHIHERKKLFLMSFQRGTMRTCLPRLIGWRGFIMLKYSWFRRIFNWN